MIRRLILVAALASLAQGCAMWARPVAVQCEIPSALLEILRDPGPLPELPADIPARRPGG